MRSIKLAETEYILAVTPKLSHGSEVIYLAVYIASEESKFRVEYLNSQDLTVGMRALLGPGVAMTQALLSALPVTTEKPKRTKVTI